MPPSSMNPFQNDPSYPEKQLLFHINKKIVGKSTGEAFYDKEHPGQEQSKITLRNLQTIQDFTINFRPATKEEEELY